jgi:hypothetical protein
MFKAIVEFCVGVDREQPEKGLGHRVEKMYDLYDRDENLINLLLAFLIEIVFWLSFYCPNPWYGPRDLFPPPSSCSARIFVVTKPEMKMSQDERREEREKTFFPIANKQAGKHPRRKIDVKCRKI